MEKLSGKDIGELLAGMRSTMGGLGTAFLHDFAWCHVG